MTKFLPRLVSVLVSVLIPFSLLFLLSGCATAESLRTSVGGAVSGFMTKDGPAAMALTDPSMRARGVVLDATTSTDGSFAESVRREISEAISLPPKPEFPRNGAEAVSGMELIIYLVGSNPYQYDGQIAHRKYVIPGICGLPPAPAADSEYYLEEYTVWTELAAEWEKAYDRTLAAAATVKREISALSFAYADNQNSGIINTLLALLSILPAQGDAKILIASDLIDNVAIQPISIDTNFAGVKAVVIQPVPDGDVASAARRESGMKNVLSEQGISDVTFYRPEQMSETISEFMR
jgi:hypothetical protein